jgi:hypothetical protein
MQREIGVSPGYLHRTADWQPSQRMCDEKMAAAVEAEIVKVDNHQR